MDQVTKIAQIYDSAEWVRSGAIADLRDYWTTKLGGRSMPHPDAIDLYEIPRLRHGIILTGYVGGRVRYDVAGSTQIHYTGHNFTGGFLDEQGWSEETFIARAHARLRETRAPVYGFYHWDFRAHLPGFSEFGFFPLSEDGVTVSAGIGFDDCSEFESVLDRAR
jgi:hypothetical protein